jgi:hypothetical protein
VSDDGVIGGQRVLTRLESSSHLAGRVGRCLQAMTM